MRFARAVPASLLATPLTFNLTLAPSASASLTSRALRLALRSFSFTVAVPPAGSERRRVFSFTLPWPGELSFALPVSLTAQMAAAQTTRTFSLLIRCLRLPRSFSSGSLANRCTRLFAVSAT